MWLRLLYSLLQAAGGAATLVLCYTCWPQTIACVVLKVGVVHRLLLQATGRLRLLSYALLRVSLLCRVDKLSSVFASVNLSIPAPLTLTMLGGPDAVNVATSPAVTLLYGRARIRILVLARVWNCAPTVLTAVVEKLLRTI